MRRALLILIAAVAAGCGGSAPEGEPPEEWAASVCGSLDEWRQTVEQRERELSQGLTEIDSVDDAKRELLAFLDDVADETDRMLQDVEAAGTPAVEDGEAVARDMRNGLGRLQTAFERARTETQRVETDDPARFQQDVTRISQRLEQQAAAIEETFDELEQKHDVPELDEAFEDEPACRSLQGG